MLARWPTVKMWDPPTYGFTHDIWDLNLLLRSLNLNFSKQKFKNKYLGILKICLKVIGLPNFILGKRDWAFVPTWDRSPLYVEQITHMFERSVVYKSSILQGQQLSI